MFISDGKNPRVIPFPVGTGGVSRGELCVMSSTTAVKAAAAPTAATVIGIACGNYASGETGLFELVDDHKITAAYTGAATPALGAVYDLSNAATVNSDDTTGGCCVCIGVDVKAKTIDFVIPESFKYL